MVVDYDYKIQIALVNNIVKFLVQARALHESHALLYPGTKVSVGAASVLTFSGGIYV